MGGPSCPMSHSCSAPPLPLDPSACALLVSEGAVVTQGWGWAVGPREGQQVGQSWTGLGLGQA